MVLDDGTVLLIAERGGLCESLPWEDARRMLDWGYQDEIVLGMVARSATGATDCSTCHII